MGRSVGGDAMSEEPTTYIRPEYRLCSGRHTCDGVLFISYSVGITRYARISEDGQIFTSDTSQWRSTYTARVIGHGTICSKSGRPKRFRTQEAAMKAGVALFRKLRVESKKP